MLHYLSILKNTRVSQVVLDKWFPLKVGSFLCMRRWHVINGGQGTPCGSASAAPRTNSMCEYIIGGSLLVHICMVLCFCFVYRPGTAETLDRAVRVKLRDGSQTTRVSPWPCMFDQKRSTHASSWRNRLHTPYVMMYTCKMLMTWSI